MDRIKNSILNLIGEIYIPKAASENYKKILHISDTPTGIYGSLIKLVKKTNPDVLIHTGDIADDIKLEMVPELVGSYRVRVNRFISNISPYIKDKIIIVPGNHDNMDVLKDIDTIDIIPEGTALEIYGIKIGLAHMFENLPSDCSLYMFGHCRTYIEDESYINGIDGISIINTENKDITKLYYPSGTDSHRTRKRKIGI